MSSDTEGFVLAGGRSSRMGEDKALVLFMGKPLIAQAIGLLRSAGVPVRVAGARVSLENYAPVVPDFVAQGKGPLGGICTALDAMEVERAVFLPVDMPLMSAELLWYLQQRACVTGCAVTVASVNGVAQTFPVVIGKAALPHLLSEMLAGRRACLSAFVAATEQMGQIVDVVPVELIRQCGHVGREDNLTPAHWFLNVNCSADLVWAEHFAAAIR